MVQSTSLAAAFRIGQKSEEQFMHKSILILKCFGVKNYQNHTRESFQQTRESFLKIVYIINSCSASHQVSFYGH